MVWMRTFINGVQNNKPISRNLLLQPTIKHAHDSIKIILTLVAEGIDVGTENQSNGSNHDKFHNLQYYVLE